MRRMERAGKAGEGEGVFWGGLVVCCERKKERKKEQKDVQTAERMKTQSIKEDLLCK